MVGNGTDGKPWLVQAQNVESIDLKLRARQTAQPRGWRFDSDAYAKNSQITMPRSRVALADAERSPPACVSASNIDAFHPGLRP